MGFAVERGVSLGHGEEILEFHGAGKIWGFVVLRDGGY